MLFSAVGGHWVNELVKNKYVAINEVWNDANEFVLSSGTW